LEKAVAALTSEWSEVKAPKFEIQEATYATLTAGHEQQGSSLGSDALRCQSSYRELLEEVEFEDVLGLS
jgi:hypothetical protein